MEAPDIQLVKDRADIAETIKSYIPLKELGNGNYTGLCPFHEEKTPSFNVNSAGQYYHCFGCGASGDVIEFVKNYENLNFIDSLKTLARRCGVIIDDISQRHPSTAAKPNATADYYMTKVRGFDLTKVKGMYRQEKLRHPNKKVSDYATTVKFELENGATWERLIDASKIKSFEKMAHFHKSYKNSGWVPPGQEIKANDTVYITEGIFKSLAFHHLGLKTIAAMSTSNCPFDIINANKNKGVNWVLAADFDKAGKLSAQKYQKALKEQDEKVYIALPHSEKYDWDELYKRQELNEDYLQDSLWRGAYFLARQAKEKAFFFWAKYGYNSHIYQHKNALYKYEVNKNNSLDEIKNEALHCWAIDRQDDIQDLLSIFASGVHISLISTCVLDFLYIEREELTDKQSYFFSVNYQNKHAAQTVNIEGSALESPPPFRKALLNKTAAGMFDGKPQDLEKVKQRWFAKAPQIVKSLSHIGYHPQSGGYIFKDFGYYRGQYTPIDKKSFFRCNKMPLKTNVDDITIHHAQNTDLKWFSDYFKAFDYNGVMLLAWWLGSLFACQIRHLYESYPFFEATGDYGAGKSTQIKFLWKCVGREKYEGLDPAKSTAVGVRRNLQKVSNLPVVFLEADHNGKSKNSAFNFEEIKTAYEGNIIRSSGVETAGSKTIEPHFMGSCLISQNAEVDGSEALLSRIVHGHFTRSHHNDESKKLAEKLSAMQVDEVAGFLSSALQKEDIILKDFGEKFKEIEAEFMARAPQLQRRIIKCHAQVAALVYQLPYIFPDVDDYLCYEMKEFIFSRAEDRGKRVGGDHPMVKDFWDTVEYIATKNGQYSHLNHSCEPDSFIALNLNEFFEACAYYSQPKFSLSDLKDLLKNSRRHQFIERKSVRSNMSQKIIKCWVFKKKHAKV